MAFSLTLAYLNNKPITVPETRAVRGSEIKNLKPATVNTTGSAATFDYWNGTAWENWRVSESYATVLATMTTDEAESGSEVLTNKATTFGTLNDTLYPTTEAVYENFQPIWYAATSGTDTYTATLTPAPSAYFTGMKVQLKFGNTNTGAATINLNSLGAKALKKGVGGATALSASDLVTTKIYSAVYDGTNFQLDL